MWSKAFRGAILGALVLLGVVGGYLYWMHQQAQELPQGIAFGNGRLEATEVDVATKVAGRIAAVLVREGDDVQIGQVLARLDAEDLKAQLRAAEAQVKQARAATLESRAALASAGSQQRLARATLERSRQLAEKGFMTIDRMDRDRSAVQSADAGVAASQSRIDAGLAAEAAAAARVDALRTTLEDTALLAPISGRVLYRLAEPGEVLAAGGKVVTLLDMSDVHLSVYLPTLQAGAVRVGSDARILLDALPDQPIPAHVVFVAPRSQFTPKQVETRSEREKLMFRVKVGVDFSWLGSHADLAKPGMPGVAYVRTAAGTPWPDKLTPR